MCLIESDLCIKQDSMPMRNKDGSAIVEKKASSLFHLLYDVNCAGIKDKFISLILTMHRKDQSFSNCHYKPIYPH